MGGMRLASALVDKGIMPTEQEIFETAPIMWRWKKMIDDMSEAATKEHKPLAEISYGLGELLGFIKLPIPLAEKAVSKIPVLSKIVSTPTEKAVSTIAKRMVAADYLTKDRLRLRMNSKHERRLSQVVR